eukprot:CAMPEP_0197538990 /NCGR_PEP_ID=MMETSP1318-20131121/61316_1 /TAXON_ID=552666 /ORGANISM="Partenskyella glossopodia, Strain RCC365" /LENGTH=191 /DNA_ID=CAMNT_0043097575 /DNA_START=45 /DNA_END=620 /DNA_ORIENTATION=+
MPTKVTKIESKKKYQDALAAYAKSKKEYQKALAAHAKTFNGAVDRNIADEKQGYDREKTLRTHLKLEVTGEIPDITIEMSFESKHRPYPNAKGMVEEKSLDLKVFMYAAKWLVKIVLEKKNNDEKESKFKLTFTIEPGDGNNKVSSKTIWADGKNGEVKFEKTTKKITYHINPGSQGSTYSMCTEQHREEF